MKTAKVVLITFFILSLCPFLSQGQDKEYGFVVETRIYSNSISTSEAITDIYLGNNTPPTYASIEYNILTTTPETQYFYDFIYLPDNFYSTTIDMYMRLHQACQSGGNYQLSKTNFSSGTYFHLDACGIAITVYPIHIKEPAANTEPLCFGDEITLTSGYQWKYQLEDGDWEPFPLEYNNRPSTTFTLENLLGDKYDNEEVIRFKTGYGEDFTNIVTYSIKNSAPDLTFRKDNALCSYSGGTITVTLNEDLDIGETLSLQLITKPNGPAFQRTWTGLEQGDTAVWKRISPGTYFFSYQSLNNGIKSCKKELGEITITSPNPVSFTISTAANAIQNVSCYEGNNGSIKIVPTGGNGSYQYKLNGVTTWQALASSKIISGLSAGNQVIKLQDTKGCMFGDGITESFISKMITQPSTGVNISIGAGTEPTAHNYTDGSISASANGGTTANGFYNFTWRKKNNATILQNRNNINSDILNDRGAGEYTLTVTDDNGCTAVKDQILDQPYLLQLSLSQSTLISCNEENTEDNSFYNNGAITATLSGGVSPYTFKWKKETSPGVWGEITGTKLSGTTSRINNLGSGRYAANVTDAKGIYIGTYDYPNNRQTAPVDETLAIAQPAAINIAFNNQNVYCYEGSDGTITPNVTGGNGGFTYAWDNGSTIANRTGLIADTYEVTVTDQKYCIATASTTITQPTSPVQIQYSFVQPTFNGATNGSIEATITGGTPNTNGSYAYLWQNSSDQNLATQVTPVTPVVAADGYHITLGGIGEDIYSLTIKDKNYMAATTKTGCTVIDSEFEIDDPELLTLSVQQHTPISCNSANVYGDPADDGALEAIADGGIQLQPSVNNGLSYYYTWKKETSPGVWETLPSQTSNIATGLDNGKYAVNIEDANGIVIGVYESNALSSATDVTHDFEEPSLLTLGFTKQDSYCHDGSDGWAEAVIDGGTADYAISWNNGDLTVKSEELATGTYTATVTDDRDCQVIESIEILHPEEALQIDYLAFGWPSTLGANDGWIEAQISGGTALADESYRYSWADNQRVSLNTQTTTSFVGTDNDVFQVRVNNVPAGEYLMTIEDGNYDIATSQEGCTTIDHLFTLYDPIEASIEVYQPVSCNQYNSFDNPFADGQLKVTVTGGLPFASGESYLYHWKKQDGNGNYIDLPTQSSDIAMNLSTGNYALNVTDALGYSMGVYDSYTLVDAIDAPFTFEEPELLEVSLSSTPISCDAGNNGTATVSITGGIAPYAIEWSNAQTSASIENLIAGTYIAYITDARGCEATGQVVVGQPGGLDIAVTEQVHPTCYEGEDGSIAVLVTGGYAPYTYLWNNVNASSSLTNLGAGSYTLELIDANECHAFAQVVLTDPDPILVDIGRDRTLCNGQSHTLDISINDAGASYLWTSDNGFSSTAATVTITDQGSYTATVTTGLGCQGSDEIKITTASVDIDSEFLLSSQAFADEDVVLVNTSNPLSEVVQWIVPAEAEIKEESNDKIILQFDQPGNYQVTLQSFQGDCYQERSKTIVVEDAVDLPDIGDAETPFIIEFSAYPNPTTGSFTVAVKLAESATISLRLYSITSNMSLDDRQAYDAGEYELKYDTNLPSGIYFLLMETAKGSEIRKLMIQ